ncbi:MAG: hypothetical protein IJ390_11505 [Lachnospiraceae bacterium]|nr:hypothetical protein [Lachnospiraceae bacterium]
MASNDFKYVVQDFNRFYIGARWTYGEMMVNEYMPFKWKAIIAHYIMKAVDPDTTMENHIFFLTEEDFAYQTYRELKAKFKMNVWVPADGKRNRTGHYESRTYSIEEIVKSKELHDRMDTIIVEELQLSKLQLMSFAV